MRHPRKTSKIAELIDRQLERALPDTDSPCTTKTAPCKLAPGIEHLFVNQAANYLVGRLRKEIKKTWEFRELVYCPHQTIEKKCGFDLSLGHYQRPNRVRTMHKLYFGKNLVHPWPDEDWSWSTLGGNAKERLRIKKHLLLLLDVYKNRKCFEPFLVLHLCFCIHDYRRMSISEDRITIPAFESPLRTFVVDLRPLVKAANYNPLINAEPFALTIRHNHATGTTKAKLSGFPSRVSLPVWDLKTLGDHAVKRAKVHF